jgi:hypothetical protein
MDVKESAELPIILKKVLSLILQWFSLTFLTLSLSPISPKFYLSRLLANYVVEPYYDLKI